MTRKIQKFLLTLGAVTAGFFVVLFLGALVSGDLTPSTEQTAPLIPEWKPRVKEFTLDDGTRCISVSTRATNFPTSAGFSGISCNWDKE